MVKKAVFAFIILFMVSGQASGAENQPAPVEPPQDCLCKECGMYIRGEGVKFASEVIFEDGKTLFFCDLGDLFVYFNVLRKKGDVAAIYVRDYLTGGWIDGRAGFYLAGAKVVTPMRYGIIAFKDRAAAAGFMKQKGGDRIYTFDEVIASGVYRR